MLPPDSARALPEMFLLRGQRGPRGQQPAPKNTNCQMLAPLVLDYSDLCARFCRLNSRCSLRRRSASASWASFFEAKLLFVDCHMTRILGDYYAPATVVSLKATANAGYKFVNWTGPVASSNAASTTVTMSPPETVIANFTLLPTALVGYVSTNSAASAEVVTTGQEP